jgi:four helix bundle protein
MEKTILKYNLEDRLVKLACSCLEICDLLPNTRSANNLEYQLSKSGTAPALLYGEAQAAESRADFIHKMKIALNPDFAVEIYYKKKMLQRQAFD